MPKAIRLDPDKPKKKRKRKKRKIDYTVYLVPPVVPDQQCIHTTKPVEATACSQCMSVTPSVTKKPPTTDWWAEDDNEALIEEISLEEFDNSHFVELVDTSENDPF